MRQETIDVPIRDQSQVAEGRRVARDLAGRWGFDETAAERVAIVATELCTNLIKHGGGGNLLIGMHADSDAPTVEIISLDNGPGMRDLAQCFRDGFTTSTSPGNGLGAVARLSDHIDVYSNPGLGTAIISLIGPLKSGGRALPHSPVLCGAVRVSKPGQLVCGDDWALVADGQQFTLMIADGLGHGPDAAHASGRAVDAAYRHPACRPRELLEIIHGALRSTRGAAVGIARVDVERRTVAFCGAGNIAACVVVQGRPTQHLVSVNGTAGHEVRKLNEYSYAWPDDGVLLMHSDGLNTRWDLNTYPGILNQNPTLVAGILYRDHRRNTDDTTVAALRFAS